MFAILPLLLLNAQFAGQAPAGLVCGDRDAQTPALKNRAGDTVVLSMHSEDDHGKETHLCESTYVLHIARPDGSRTTIPSNLSGFGFFTNDDEWNRPIAFRVEGFSSNGGEVFLSIAEGGPYSTKYFEEISLKTGREVKSESAGAGFLHRLGTDCAASLHVVDVSRTGNLVVQSSKGGGCASTQLWELSPNRRVSQSSLSGTVPGVPHKVSSNARTSPLDPGSPATLTD